MKLVMTLLARNEADIVDAQIAFHLHAGVDFVIATDNDSDDGTLEILERYERAGVLHLLHQEGRDMRQSEWVTGMARLAATDFGADWVINTDADEFWWPRGGSLKDVLELVPERYGVVRGCWRHFLARADGDPFFAERMTIRLCAPAAPGDKRTIYHVHQKVAHRADARVEVEAGNHDATGAGLAPLRGWFPIEVLHFSIRSAEQALRKGEGGWLRPRSDNAVEHQLRLERAFRERRIDEFFQAHAVSDDDVSRGLADGTLAVDVRLRDVLRGLRTPDGRFRPPAAGAGITCPRPEVQDSAALAGEVSELAAIDGIVRAELRVLALEERLAALRRLPRR